MVAIEYQPAANGEPPHPFWDALVGTPPKREQSTSAPLEFQISLAAMFSANKLKAPTVFVSGGLYGEGLDLNGNRIMLDWPQEIGRKLTQTGFIPLTGIDMELYDASVAAGAGKSLFNLHLSNAIVVVGDTRFGPAVTQEVAYAVHAGTNLGFVPPPEHAQHIIEFLQGKTKVFPKGLPAWWGTFDLQWEDIIPTRDDIAGWVENQRNLTDRRRLQGRSVEGSTISRMMYYGLTFAATDKAEQAILTKILDAMDA
jgi:hypothetical protein